MNEKQPPKMKVGSVLLMRTRLYQHPVMLPGHKAWRVEGMHWGHVTGYSWQGLWWGAWPHPADKEVTERRKQGVNMSALHFRKWTVVTVGYGLNEEEITGKGSVCHICEISWANLRVSMEEKEIVQEARMSLKAVQKVKSMFWWFSRCR